MEQQKLPNATLILVFGIISIVTCCCYGVVGLILGIIAIVLAAKATKVYNESPELYTGYGNVKAGRILAIIGVILNLLFAAYMIWIYIEFGPEMMDDPEALQQAIEEYFSE